LSNVHLTSNTAVVEGGGVYGSSSATISAGNSCISGNSSRAIYSASSATQNFENNWWGATNGPSGSGSGSGDAVNSKIDFTPFIATACPLP
jgi:predicted outer membrane repeat protein